MELIGEKYGLSQIIIAMDICLLLSVSMEKL